VAITLGCQLLAEADHDQPFRRVGHSTTGEAGSTSLPRPNGRGGGASPPPRADILPVRSGSLRGAELPRRNDRAARPRKGIAIQSRSAQRRGRAITFVAMSDAATPRSPRTGGGPKAAPTPVTPENEQRPYIGGQAVIEGVMMRSPRSFSVVVRRK